MSALAPPSDLVRVIHEGTTYLHVDDTVIYQQQQSRMAPVCSRCPNWTSTTTDCRDMHKLLPSAHQSTSLCGNKSFVPLHEYVAWRLSNNNR